MNLSPGLRLSNGAGADYDIVGAAWSTPRHEYFRARKVLRNFRYPAASLEEASPEEGLDVLIRRTIGARAERERDLVFALPFGHWFLEPLDDLEMETPGHGSEGRESLLVLADPHAEVLKPAGSSVAESLSVRTRLVTEILTMLDDLHQAGLVATSLDPTDFLLDPTGRWFYLGTDLIAESAPGRSPREDLGQWACLALRLLTESARLDDFAALGPLEPPRLLDWLRRCLDPDPTRRPSSVAELTAAGRGRLGFLRFLRRG